MKEMNDRWQFPFCRIAIDGCHILIKCPPGGAASCKEYHNFKNCYSVVMMAMVDLRYRFIWGSCGFPMIIIHQPSSSGYDLWEKLKEQNFLPDIGLKIADVIVRPLISGIPLFRSSRNS